MKPLTARSMIAIILLTSAGIYGTARGATTNIHITLTPPNEISKSESCMVQPNQTANFTVTINSGNGWSLVSSSVDNISYSSPHFVWIGGGGGGSYSFQVLNTCWQPENTTVQVICKWKKTGDGPGGGGTAEYLDGDASGSAGGIKAELFIEADPLVQAIGGDPITAATFGLFNYPGATTNIIAATANWSTDGDADFAGGHIGMHEVQVTNMTAEKITITALRTNLPPQEATAPAWFAEIRKLKYHDGAGWREMTNTVYVCAETNLAFRVTPNPGDIPEWPYGKPVWTGAEQDEEDVALAAQEFTEPGTNHIIAECGNVVTGTVVIIKVELDIWNGGGYLGIGDVVGCMPSAPVDESEKYAVGAFLQVNWDNDDGSGTRNPDGSWAELPVPDLEKDYVENENNLAQLRPQVEPLPDDGTVTLKVTGPDKDKVKLWTESTKGTELPLSSYSINWNLSNAGDRAALKNFMENSLWIEGIAPGTAQRGVTFSLSYSRDENIVCEDEVRATVVFMRLGSAVYRELDQTGVRPRGHGAILYRFMPGVELASDNLLSPENYQVLHSMAANQGDGPTIDEYTNISDHPSAAHWPGCYETIGGLPYSQRLLILHEADALYALHGAIEYSGINNVIVTTSGGTDTWNGSFDDIIALRCDGLIEVLYEKPGAYIGHVWGKLHEGVYRFNISTYAFLHNQQNHLPGYWTRHLNPGTQSGRTTPTGGATTQFQHRSHIVEPSILE